jgi:hypothetical protein
METKNEVINEIKKFLWKDKQDWHIFSQTNQKKKGDDLN